jgi:2-dehydropantoate 2-reductase
MKIAIAGAGAMGSRFGLMLHQGGNDVTLIDGWKEHIETIRKHGLSANLNGQELTAQLKVELQSEVNLQNEMELIILFTKAMQLDKMLSDIQPMLSENTKVLCLLNGIGHEDIIEKICSNEEYFHW